MKAIVKVQAPLFPVGAPALVYNRTRSVMLQCPLDSLMKKMLGGRVKGYFQADIENGKVRLIKRVPDRDW